MIKIKIEGDLSGIQKVIDDASKIDVGVMADIIRDDIIDRFEEGTNWRGGKMKPLKKETINIKRKKGGINPSKPMVFKGGTRNGIKSEKLNSKEAIIIPTGTAKGYYGGEISSVDVIRFQRDKGRDPFGISKKASKEIDKYIEKTLG